MNDSSYRVIAVEEVQGWDDEADLVVAGLGVAGACAAIEARGAGADVVVLERASGGGGISASAAGHFYLGGGTRVQRAVGVEDTAEEMEKFLLAVTPEPDRDKIRLYCEESVSHFDWLVAQGIPFKDSMYPEKHVLQPTDECLIWSGNEEVYPFRDLARPAPRGHKVAEVGDKGGAKMMTILVERVEALGARIHCDAALRALVREGDRIVGVRYQHFQESCCIRARRGVILATGHFTNNPEMLEKYCPQLADDRMDRQLTPYDDGAGIQLGMAAGGAVRHMEGALVTCPFYPPEGLIRAILVNKEGCRYVAEDSYHSRSSIATTQQTDAVGYLIVDDAIFARPEWGGYELVDAWESVEAMERGLGMPEGSLRETLRNYNAHAARGEDPEFHKSAKWLAPLEHPPFAALVCSLDDSPFLSFTLGGLAVSIDGEVLREDGAGIPGLYAAGACASNIAQDGTGYSSGTCVGESSFFGRRAGLHAAGRR